MDGSAISKLGLAGISRMLRNDFQAVKIVFSKAIGIVDSNLIELLVVKEAFIVFVA